MTTDRAEILLHPVRLRIVQALIGRELTTRGLAAQLPEVAIATLYRHLRRLVEAGLLTVVATRQVRGRTERTYALVTEATHLDADAVRELTPEDHVRYLQVFIASLLEHGVRYLEHEDADPTTDGFGYSQVALWLDDDELETFATELNQMLGRYLEEGPRPGRRRRLLTTFVLPDLGEDRPNPTSMVGEEHA